MIFVQNQIWEANMNKNDGLRPKQLFIPVFITSLLLCSLLLLANMAAGNGETGSGTIVTSLKRVSVNENGEEGDGESTMPAISADGRYVAFYSLANNLVMSDTNTFVGWDVFVYDLETDTIELVSVNSNGEQGNALSTSPDISADGRYVVFESYATNLVISDTNNLQDVFVYDQQTGITRRVSVNSVGEQGNGNSGFSTISGDGRYVAFSSSANNLVADDTNGDNDVFVHDLQTGATERVSVSSQGIEGSWHSSASAISNDGQFVAFRSSASNLVPGDTNSVDDIFVHDRQTGQTNRVSVSSTGQEGNGNSWFPDISADGRYVAFFSYATNLIPNVSSSQQVYLHDRQTGTLTLVSASSSGEVGNDRSGPLAISPDGRYVTFGSWAFNLVEGDNNGLSDIFIHDQVLGITVRVSITPDGTQGNETSWGPAIAAGGQTVAFWARADNLVVGDNNGEEDVFVSKWRLFQAYLPVAVR
jgi:Tol biopolymer transport system component